MSQSKPLLRPCIQEAKKRWAMLYEQKSVTNTFARANKLNIRIGEIVFLKQVDYLHRHDYNCLIETGYLPVNAAGHPVIILSYQPGSTHAIVTTISAYSSSEWNNYLAPWNQRCHASKRRCDFRAFQGSENPDRKRPLLYLEDNKLMPKPQVSWVYTKNAFVVPITSLQEYNKSPTRLRMTQKSFDDLRAHMIQTPSIRELVNDSRLFFALVDGKIKAPTASLPTKTQSTVAKAASHAIIQNYSTANINAGHWGTSLRTKERQHLQQEIRDFTTVR